MFKILLYSYFLLFFILGCQKENNNIHEINEVIIEHKEMSTIEIDEIN